MPRQAGPCRSCRTLATMSPTAFRCTVAAAFVLPFGALAIDLLYPGLIPPALVHARDAEPLPSTYDEWWFIVTTVALGLLFVVAWVGLALFKRWSRRLALWVSVVGLGYYPLTGATVSSGLAAGLSEVSAMLWGAALAVAYFSPLRVRFEGTNGG